MKPTKEQIKDAIYCFIDCSEVKYDSKKKEFSFIGFFQKPHYDSGGGVDAIDIEEFNSSLTLKEGIRLFRDYKNLKKQCDVKVIPDNKDGDFDDLPF